MRIVFTDGEMSNLDANFGQLLCAGLLEYTPVTGTHKKPWNAATMRVLTLRDYNGKRWDDKSLALQWKKELEKYDIVVSWNGIRFDVPFLDTRLKYWNLRASSIKRHKDLMYTARFGLRLTDAKLDNVALFLDVHRKYGVRKTRMEPKRWTMAMGGHRPSYEYIINHNKLDLMVLAGVWEELREHIREIK